MIYRLIIFLILNFGSLALSGSFTSKGVPSDWYINLNKAPWTPPGWAFGVTWTIIMICFSFYMAILWPVSQHRNLLLGLFIIQWLLNISWSPTFFYYHQVLTGFIILTALTVIVGIFIFLYWPQMKLKTALLLPYLLWLMIATSLNGYIYLNN